MSANPLTCGAQATVSGRARLIPFFFTQLSTTIPVWIERSRQRRALGELADRKDHLLADIGLSVEEARHEAAKPFWAWSDVPPATEDYVRVLAAPAPYVSARSAIVRHLEKVAASMSAR